MHQLAAALITIGLAMVTGGILLLTRKPSLLPDVAYLILVYTLLIVGVTAVITGVILLWKERHKAQDGLVPPTGSSIPTASTPMPTNTVTTHVQGRPPTLGKGFFGRESTLTEISDTFKEHRVVVLSGGAGYGKSQLAAEYGYYSGQQGFWSAAGSTAEQTLAALAGDLNVPEGNRTQDDIAADVSRELAKMPPETLWIVDNAAEISMVNALTPLCGNVKLLLTTRMQNAGQLPPYAKALLIEVLEVGPAVDLLRSRREIDPNDPDLPRIAEAVGRLPMALEMLASRLADFAQTPGKLLDEIQQAPTAIQLEAFQDAMQGAAIPRAESVFATIAGMLNSFSPEVREAISPLGYIADAPVPLGLLMALTELDEDGIANLVTEGRRHSVISSANNDKEITLHSLTVAAIAATNAEGAMAAAFHRASARVLEIRLDNYGILRQEIDQWEQLYERCKAALDQDDEAVLGFSNNLANRYSNVGRYEEAIRLGEQTLETMERVLGAEHPDTLTSRNNLAVRYSDVGRYEEAIRLGEQTLEARERVLGTEHPRTLTSKSNLALGYGCIGNFQDAIKLEEQVLEARERLLGPDHPQTLISRNNLASYYDKEKRYEVGIKLGEQTLKAMEQVQGKDHPYTITSKSNLAHKHSNAGRDEEAIVLGRQALERSEQVMGADHPQTLEIRNNLAVYYSNAGRDEEAIVLGRQALEASEQVRGADHPRTQ